MTAAETRSPGVTCSPRHSPLPDNCSGVIFCLGCRGSPGASPRDLERQGQRCHSPLNLPRPAHAERHQEPNTENTGMASTSYRKKYLSFVRIPLQTGSSENRV
ncbi:hypothetical protein CgunFtcFv8_017285 [Champsocephalus gunnari]|uniref:Uncharacterized protein n=1 Tax=Champsocephalus gunnari TaxID=52237 RepID=A0AAN8DMG1_CHAGU|nr:hypothetical protein CgunFtcFv8_017285 [Champsocephalus gunnari]